MHVHIYLYVLRIDLRLLSRKDLCHCVKIHYFQSVEVAQILYAGQRMLRFESVPADCNVDNIKMKCNPIVMRFTRTRLKPNGSLALLACQPLPPPCSARTRLKPNATGDPQYWCLLLLLMQQGLRGGGGLLA